MKILNTSKTAIITAIVTLSALTSAVNAQEKESNKKLFDDNCGICHGPGEVGTDILSQRVGAERAVLAERSDLNAAYIKVVARNGLVAMPPMTRGDVSGPELDAIIEYLTRTR